GATNAPRVVRAVEGDFRAEVVVAGTFRGDPRSLIPGRWPFYAAGLLVWQDEKNYVRFERALMHYPNDGWRCYPNWQQHRDGEISQDLANYGFSLDEQKPTVLRLERNGNTLTASFSQDRKQWKELPPIRVELSKKVIVGVAAIQNTPSEYEAVFEEFKLTSVNKVK